MAQNVVEAVAQKNWIPNVKILPQLHPSPRTPKFISADASSGIGFGGLEAAVVSQVVHEDLTTTKAKAPSLKQAQKRRTIASTHVTTISPLNTPLSNESRLTSLSGEGPQGPSPMDNDLKLDADFLLDMVTVMQEGATRKARRMLIGRTIRSKPTIKVLNDCLKLHMLTFFLSVTL
jgi:hypothetical protein